MVFNSLSENGQYCVNIFVRFWWAKKTKIFGELVYSRAAEQLYKIIANILDSILCRFVMYYIFTSFLSIEYWSRTIVHIIYVFALAQMNVWLMHCFLWIPFSIVKLMSPISCLSIIAKTSDSNSNSNNKIKSKTKE